MFHSVCLCQVFGRKLAGNNSGRSKTFHKKYFFLVVKNFPHEIENTREIIENMSEIIQNISDIFFATYTPVDFQVLDR